MERAHDTLGTLTVGQRRRAGASTRPRKLALEVTPARAERELSSGWSFEQEVLEQAVLRGKGPARRGHLFLGSLVSERS